MSKDAVESFVDLYSSDENIEESGLIFSPTFDSHGFSVNEFCKLLKMVENKLIRDGANASTIGFSYEHEDAYLGAKGGFYLFGEMK